MNAVEKSPPPKKQFHLGFIGDPSIEYDILEVQRFEQLFDSIIDSTENVLVVSKFINRGSNKLAYDWAWKRDIKIAGIAAIPDCWTYPCRLVSKIKLIAGPPGTENKYFAEFCDGLVIVEHTEEAEEIMQLMYKQKKQIANLTTRGKT